MQKHVNIIGSGLAGSEAAYFLAKNGVPVRLFEMRPKKMTEAHKTALSAELVCSNSLKSRSPTSGPGMLKAEMWAIGSLILEAAFQSEVPAGDALAVDRDRFSKIIDDTLLNHRLIEKIEYEVTAETMQELQNEITIVCTGPLTTSGLTDWICEQTNEEDLYFHDAVAPIIEASSIDESKTFLANRYGKGDMPAYLNCPLTKDEYENFIDALLEGEKVAPKEFEKEKLFQGCQPIESIAEGGRESLRFGAMKPVGLTDPNSPDKPYAVVQLRPENKSRTAYNIVGFQTKLKYGEQKRIFSMIPALREAKFLRLGSIHRNTYLNSPRLLRPDLSLKGCPTVYFAGQITGVEGYLESAACGLIASVFILQRMKGLVHSSPPINSAYGAVLRYLTAGDPENFQPTNVHYGLFEPTLFKNTVGQKKGVVREQIAEQAKNNFTNWWNQEQNRLNPEDDSEPPQISPSSQLNT